MPYKVWGFGWSGFGGSCAVAGLNRHMWRRGGVRAGFVAKGDRGAVAHRAQRHPPFCVVRSRIRSLQVTPGDGRFLGAGMACLRQQVPHLGRDHQSHGWSFGAGSIISAARRALVLRKDLVFFMHHDVSFGVHRGQGFPFVRSLTESG